jgi:LAS superfamily LD-carboxypeptidase LdcB
MALLAASPAGAAVPHVIQPGETLSGIATANGLTTEGVAAHNGISPDTYVIAGETIEIPTAEEAAAAAPASTSTSYAPGSGLIESPWGALSLDPAAADAWNQMAAAALEQYGVELHPAGPVSAMRTYEQQAELYEQFLAGTGAPANPPGTSSHELGVAVDLATSEMRSVVDAIGGAYGWSATIPSEWWHVSWGGY